MRATNQQCIDSETTANHFVVLVGAFAANIVSFGWITGSAVLFDYYRTHVFVSQSTFAISWLRSLGFGCLYAASLPLVMICSSSGFGPRRGLLMGALIDTVALAILPMAASPTEVLVSQAFLGPFASSIILNGSFTILSKWFHKHATNALSIAAAGGGVGATLFPLLINGLLPRFGYMLTMNICTATNIVLLLTICLTLKLPVGVKHERYAVELANLFKSTRFVVSVCGSVMFIAGYYTIISFIVAVANARGMEDPSLALAVASGSGIPGRLISGWIGSRYGLYNTLILFTFLAWVSMLSLFVDDAVMPITLLFCALWGFFSSSSICLLPAIILKSSPTQEASARLGFAYSMMSVTVLIGSPIGDLLVDSTGTYNILILVCGICQAAGWTFWVACRSQKMISPNIDIV